MISLFLWVQFNGGCRGWSELGWLRSELTCLGASHRRQRKSLG